MDNIEIKTQPDFPPTVSEYVATYEIYRQLTSDDCIKAIDSILDGVREKSFKPDLATFGKYIDTAESQLMALWDLIEEKDPTAIHTEQ